MFEFFSLYKVISKDLVKQYKKNESESSESDSNIISKKVWDRYLRNHSEKILENDSQRKKTDLLMQIDHINYLIQNEKLNLYAVYDAIISIEIDILKISDTQYNKIMDYFINYSESNGISYSMEDIESTTIN